MTSRLKVMARVKRMQAEARREDADRGKTGAKAMKGVKGINKLRRIVPEPAEPKAKPGSVALQGIKKYQATTGLMLKKGASSALCARLRKAFALIYASSQRHCSASRQLERRI